MLLEATIAIGDTCEKLSPTILTVFALEVREVQAAVVAEALHERSRRLSRRKGQDNAPAFRAVAALQITERDATRGTKPIYLCHGQLVIKKKKVLVFDWAGKSNVKLVIRERYRHYHTPFCQDLRSN